MEQTALFAHHDEPEEVAERVLGRMNIADGPQRVAAVGPRSVTAEVVELCQKVAARCVQEGHAVVSGGAPGADRAFIAGAARVSPANAEIVLPWATFEAQQHPDGVRRRVYRPEVHARWLEIAASHHPAWPAVHRSVKALHARNTGILIGDEDDDQVAVVMAVVRRTRHGGTEQTLRVAKALGIPVVLIATV